MSTCPSTSRHPAARKILAVPDGSWLAHVSRPLEVAKALRSLGHEVVFAGDGKHMDLPRQAGFEVLTIVSLPPDHVLEVARRGRVHWYERGHMETFVEAELDLLSQVRPDMVLGDFRFSLTTSCELAGIPLTVLLNASWTNFYSVKWRAPEHSGFTRVLGKRLATAIMPALKAYVFSADSRPIRSYRKARGLAPRKNLWDIWRGDLNLIVDIPEYGPTENLPPDYVYVGPIIWEPEMPTPNWLATLDPARPTIYFTMGSTGNERFFKRAVDVFGGTDYQCVMTTAGQVRLGEVPGNFHVTDYAPGSAIIAVSDVVVCHGGNGTIYQALAGGVPIVGIPTMHDQEFNLDRVMDLGVGLHLSERRHTLEDLRAAVETVLENKIYRRRAERLRETLGRYRAPVTAAQLIIDYLSRPP